MKNNNEIKYKTLYNKSVKALDVLRDMKQTLMFQSEDMETQRHIFKAIDEISSFIDNLKRKGEWNNIYC